MVLLDLSPRQTCLNVWARRMKSRMLGSSGTLISTKNASRFGVGGSNNVYNSSFQSDWKKETTGGGLIDDVRVYGEKNISSPNVQVSVQFRFFFFLIR